MAETLVERLREAANEIALEGAAGWGNTCADAADRIEELERQLAKAQKEARAFYALSEERMRIIEATRMQLAEARQELKTAQKYIRVHMPYPPDYACVDCAPRSEILIKDFQCAYHKSIRALEGQT